MDNESPLAFLLDDPEHSALLTDVDGTLCRIVGRPEMAKVPAPASRSLDALAGRLALVACITGRPARRAREMVGLDSVTYFGNHGIELIRAGKESPAVMLDPEEASRAREFITARDNPFWVAAGIRVEDKGPIQALHWRGAGDRTEVMMSEIATEAEQAGLAPHWGRKVLELRPPGMEGKAGAVEELLKGTAIRNVVFAGDDRTDLDAAKRLRELEASGEIERLILIAIDSDEGPDELVEIADVVLPDTDAWVAMVGELAS
jgi:trehalose 6-phosphate phosphatase